MPAIYKYVANPYMPNGTPDKTNSPSPYYAPGELGYAFVDQNTGGHYLRVQLDSGATAATGIGVVAAGQLAFWKDRANAIVTNDKNQSDLGPTGAINGVAGVFQTAVTAAPGVNGTDGQPVMYMCDLVVRKRAYPVVADAALLGAQATASATANHAAVTYTTGVNTAPVSQVLGVFASSTIGSPGPANTAPVDVMIGFQD